VCFRIRWVVELTEDESVTAFHIGSDVLCFRYCTVHALFSGCEHHLQFKRSALVRGVRAIMFGYLLLTLAPSAFNSTLLSRLIEAGMVRISSYPFAAATIASPMPVLPEVGSTRTVFPNINAHGVNFSVVIEFGTDTSQLM
jgi:hypothetical protein